MLRGSIHNKFQETRGIPGDKTRGGGRDPTSILKDEASRLVHPYARSSQVPTPSLHLMSYARASARPTQVMPVVVPVVCLLFVVRSGRRTERGAGFQIHSSKGLVTCHPRDTLSSAQCLPQEMLLSPSSPELLTQGHCFALLFVLKPIIVSQGLTTT